MAFKRVALFFIRISIIISPIGREILLYCILYCVVLHLLDSAHAKQIEALGHDQRTSMAQQQATVVNVLNLRERVSGICKL